MRQSTVPLRLARKEISENELDAPTRTFLRTMLAGAREVRKHLENSQNLEANLRLLKLISDLLGPELTMQIQPQTPDGMLSGLTNSIRAVRQSFASWVSDYIPRNLQQLYSGDGLVSEIERPDLLLLAVFWPEDMPLFIGVKPAEGRGLPSDPELEALRSVIALRTWLYAMLWLPDQHLPAKRHEHLQWVTAWFEGHLFDQRNARVRRKPTRMKDVRFQYDPHRGFTFVRVVGEKEVDVPHTIDVSLSRRYMRVGDRLVRFYYDAGVKSVPSSMRRMWSRDNLHDMVRAKMVFESKRDYDLVFPRLQLLVFSRGEAKVIDGIRVDNHPNDASASSKGVLWSGMVRCFGSDIECELECQTMDRYFNDRFSLTLFNHLAYEVRRLIRTPADQPISFWETLFPGAMHGEMTQKLRVEMVMRKLNSVMRDVFSVSVRDKARVWLDTMEADLLANPHWVDRPSLCPQYVF